MSDETPEKPAPRRGESASRQQIARSGAVSLVGWVVQIAATFVLTPILISSLGDARYGLWSLIGAVGFNAYLLMLGAPVVVVRFLAKARAEGDVDGAREIYSTALALLTAVGAAVSLIGFAVAALMAAGVLFPETSTPELAIATAVMAFLFGMEFPAAAAGGALGSVARQDIQSHILVYRSAARLAVAIGALSFAPRLDVLALAIAAADISAQAALFLAARKFAPLARFEAGAIRKKTLGVVLNFGGFAFLSQFANKSMYYFALMIVGALMTPIMVAYYSVVIQLIARVQTAVMQAFGVLVPAFSAYASQPRSPALHARFLFTLRVATCIASIMLGGITAFGKPFLSTWISPEYATATPALVILAVASFFELSQTPMRRLAVALDTHRMLAIADVVVGVANLALTFALIGPFGLIGVALGTAIPLTIYGGFVRPAMIARKTSIPLVRLYSAQVRALVPSLILQAPIWWYASVSPPQTLIGVLALAAVSYAVIGPLVLVTALPLADLRQLVAVLPKKVAGPLTALAPVLSTQKAPA